MGCGTGALHIFNLLYIITVNKLVSGAIKHDEGVNLQVYGIRRLEMLPLVEIYVAVRPLERNGFTHKYDRLDFPVFKVCFTGYLSDIFSSQFDNGKNIILILVGC